MSRSLLVWGVLLPIVTAACTASDEPTDTAISDVPLELSGAWTIQNVKLESGELAGSHTFDVQPSVVIFTDDHYSVVAVSGFAHRGYIGSEPTDEEIARTYAPFVGHSGQYTLDDGDLRLSPLVAKDPGQMVDGAEISYAVSWTDDGDLLLDTTSEANGRETVRLVRVDQDDLDLSPTEERFQGVWRRVEQVFGTGEEAEGHLEDMQPGYYIFHGDTFAANFVASFEPRALLGEAPTEADYADAFGAYRSYAGRFSVFEDELTFWPAVAINPNNMRGRPFRQMRLEWSDDDVWMIYPNNYGIETHTRITRVSD